MRGSGPCCAWPARSTRPRAHPEFQSSVISGQGASRRTCWISINKRWPAARPEMSPRSWGTAHTCAYRITATISRDACVLRSQLGCFCRGSRQYMEGHSEGTPEAMIMATVAVRRGSIQAIPRRAIVRFIDRRRPEEGSHLERSLSVMAVHESNAEMGGSRSRHDATGVCLPTNRRGAFSLGSSDRLS
jgi:hypothetical protein